MSRRYSAAEVVAIVPGLSARALDRLVGAGILQPVSASEGPRFREIDVARLELVQDLGEHFALDDDALSLVLSLVDQLNAVRGDMRAMLEALAAEPPETRARLRTVIARTRISAG